MGEKYLRQIGALEETEGEPARVVIANYLNSPSNCIATARYFSVCCLSECAAIKTGISRKASAPTGEPDQILAAIQNLPHRSKNISELASRLHAIATETASAEISLLSTNFAHWLHRAFPSECPSLPLSETDGVSGVTHPPVSFPNAEDCTRLPSYMV